MNERKEKSSRSAFRFNSRYFLGIILIIASFLSALFITHQVNRTVLIWSSVGDLAPGDVIAESDLAITHVLLPENSAMYLSSRAQLVGALVIRKIGAKELIPAASLTNDYLGTQLRMVPLEVSHNDMPANLSRGDQVDIYSLTPASKTLSGVSKNIQADLVLASVSVVSVDSDSRNLGGAVGVVVTVADSNVQLLLRELAENRLVFVKNG